MRSIVRFFALGGLIPLAGVGACSSTPPPNDDAKEILGAAREALGGTEGTFEYAIDAPWRVEPTVPATGGATSYPPIPIQITIHDADQIADDSDGSPSTPTIGNVCELLVTEGNTRTHINPEQFAEIERTRGAWPSNSGIVPPRDVCTSTGSANCAAYRGVSGTSEWHATALYYLWGGRAAGANLPLTLDLKVSRNPSIGCDDGDESHFYKLRNYARVHLGEAPLPRFAGGWSYGDLHYHSQGTDNEGESAYNYRGVARAMEAIGVDFMWATDHASASDQIVDADIELSLVSPWKTLSAKAKRGVQRDMDRRRFMASLGFVAQANRDAALRAPGSNSVIPQIWLGGEVDVIPETNVLPIPWGNGHSYDIGTLNNGWQGKVENCKGDIATGRKCDACLTSCDEKPPTADKLLVDAGDGDGTQLVRDVQGLNDLDFGREHMVYLPDPGYTSDPFVGSYTGTYGGAERRLANPGPSVDPATGQLREGVLQEVDRKGGSVFLAHHTDAPSGSEGPDGPPWSPSMLDKAFRSRAVLGMEFWNEDVRRESTVSSTKYSSVEGYENGFQRDDVKYGVSLKMVDKAFQGVKSDSDGQFELYPFDVVNGAFGKSTSITDNKLVDGASSWDSLNLRGLDPKSSAELTWLAAGQPRKLFMAGGSDSHGDFNYRRLGYMTGSSGTNDSAIGTPRNLVFSGAPSAQVVPGTRNVNSPNQVLSALRAGHFSVTDGPALRIVYDKNRNGVIDDGDTPMGDTVDLAGATALPLLVDWISNPEFGGVHSVELTIGAVSSTTGQSRLYAGGDGPIPTMTPLADTYTENGWDYGRTDRGYWRASPTAYNPANRNLTLDVQLPDGVTCNGTCYTGSHAFTLDLTHFPAANGIPADRFFVRAFAKTEDRATPDEHQSSCPVADSWPSISGKCIKRYAYTNPVWAINGSTVWDASYPGFGWGWFQPVPADYDGDGKADLSTKDGSGHWYIDYASNGFGKWDAIYSGYGDSTAIPVPADYDGDGMADLSVKDEGGTWYIDYAANGFGAWDEQHAGFGWSWFRPVPADYDGDGKTDFSTKDGNGHWYIDYASNGFGTWDAIFNGYGDANVHPVPADYDGDGKADLSIKSDDGQWNIDFASDGFGAWNKMFTAYGPAYYEPFPADYDGDGKADLAVRDGGGFWFIDYAANGLGGWDVWGIPGYGRPNSKPVPRDYDGDGKADLAVKEEEGFFRIDYAWNGFGPTADLTRGATVVTSSSYEAEVWSRSYLVDHQMSSSNNAFGFSSWGNKSVNHTEWIEIDLPSIQTFSMVVLHPRNDPGMVGAGFPIDFRIQVWNGAEWLDRVVKTGYALPSTPQAFTWGASDRTDKIRILGSNLRTVGTDGYLMQLAEVDVYNTDRSRVNSLGQGINGFVAASSSYESPWSWAKVNLVDGKRTSVYGTSMGYSSQVGRTTNHPEWVTVTLPAITSFSKVILTPRADAGTEGRGFPVDFKIQVWNGQTWIDRVVQTNYPQPDGTPQTFSLGQTDRTDKIRIFASKLRTLSGNYLMQLAEIEVAP